MIEINKIQMPEDINFLNLEDMDSLRKMVTDHLRALGFKGEILEAACLKEAQKALNGPTKVQYIISDWNLPDGTGFELLKAIRKVGKYKNTPFLMVTTEDAVTNILDAVNEGVSSYVVKPWEAPDFDEKLAYSWDKHQKEAPAPTPEAKPDAAPQAPTASPKAQPKPQAAPAAKATAAPEKPKARPSVKVTSPRIKIKRPVLKPKDKK